jgi:hypothetical protein
VPVFVACALRLRDRESNSRGSAAVIAVSPDLGVALAESDRLPLYLRTLIRLLSSWVHSDLSCSGFHQSLRREFLLDRTFASLQAAQAELDAWVVDYNTSRPHQALEMATPAERFRLAPLSADAASIPVDAAEDHAGQWVLRRVGSNGVVSVDNQLFSVGNAYKAELVDVFVDDTVIQVWSKNHLVKTVARLRNGPVRKVRADGLHVKDQANTKRQASTGT